MPMPMPMSMSTTTIIAPIITEQPSTFTVFNGPQRQITAPLREVLTFLKTDKQQDPSQSLLVFNDKTGRTTDFNLSGTLQEVLDREVPLPNPTTKTGRGRPKLGVSSREVSLLPRHWEWLESQPNGASAALRRLIDEARKQNPQAERRRLAASATDRFLMVMGGDLAGAEEASRALYAGEQTTFKTIILAWPEDICNHMLYLSALAFAEAQE